MNPGNEEIMDTCTSFDVDITWDPIPTSIPPPAMAGRMGAWVEFRGVVRGLEGGDVIGGLDYEAYPGMALQEMRRLVQELNRSFPCQWVRIIHRVGPVPVDEAAIYVGVAAAHRREAFALLAAFMDRMKQEVPIWKTGVLPVPGAGTTDNSTGPAGNAA